MREALAGLTIRGRSFLAAAAAAGLSALLLGEKDLLRVSLLLAVLPLLAAGTVSRTRYRLACSRVLDPRRASVGGSARVVLRLENLSRIPTGTMLLEDQLPHTLGTRPRLVLERLGPHQTSTVTYVARADTRGRYDIGPLVVRLTDPFGLCELTRSFPSTDKLTVIPQVTPLPEIRLSGEYSGSGESRTRWVTMHGEDDTATREYRHGDDLRRVHWRSTARVGELMVRREEQPWESKATIVLDTRGAAHRGEGPTSSFEWLVSAAASVSLHLQNEGYKLRMVTGSGADLDAAEPNGEDSLLDYLADIRLGPRTDMTHLIERIRRRSDGGLVIALLGLVSPEEAELLAGLRRTGSICVAFLLDSTTWLQLPPAQRTAAAQAHEAAALILLRAGWRVVGVGHDSKLAALWPQAARGNQGFAFRAALAETVSPRVVP